MQVFLRRLGRIRTPAALFGALMFLSAAAGPAAAQQQAVCPDPPGNPAAGDRVLCERDAASGEKIAIDLDNFDIAAATGRGAVYAHHGGGGDNAHIDIDVTGGSITAAGRYGIAARHCALRETGHCITKGAKTGDIDIDVTGASIVMDAYQGRGVSAEHGNRGDIDITAKNVAVTVEETASHGITAWHRGSGDTRVAVTGGSVTLLGEYSIGIQATCDVSTCGSIAMNVAGVTVETGTGAAPAETSGILSWSLGNADIDIDVTGGSIAMAGERSRGISGWHRGDGGDVDIDAAGVSIVTKGDSGFGINGFNFKASGAGDIDIDLSGGASVATEGRWAHGVYAGHVSGKGRMAVTVGAGSSVTADGADASGVQIGRFNATTKALERAAEAGAGGYRKQTVTVNGSVAGGSGKAAGVYLAGGGRAVVGPAGAVRADSGIAILAARKLLADPAPKLHVSLNPGGRRIAEVPGDDWIVNDGGHTTILVNGVKLHDGETGATGKTAANGAWRVAVRKAGVTVDRTDPDNWTISDRSESTIGDRDFSAADFLETPGDGSLLAPAPVPGGGSGRRAALVGAGALAALLALISSPLDAAPEAPGAGNAPRPAFARSADGEMRYWTRDLSAPLSAAGGAAGVEFGLDAGLGGGFRLGFAAAPGMAAARADGGAAVSGARYSLRGGWRSGALFAGLSASRADWKARTSFAAPAGGLVAGAFDARQTDLRLGAGARLAPGGGVTLAPKAEVFAGRLERGAHRAEGAAFRADMPETGQHYRGWKAGLGLASGWRDAPRGMMLRPALDLSVLRTESRSDSFALKQSDRLGIVETSVRARMADAPRTVLGLAAGVEAAGPGGLRLNFGYAALKSSGGGIDHALAAGLNLRF